MRLTWNKYEGGVWCRLHTVDLTHKHFDYMGGVYIIWHGGENAHTVRVGQGVIRDRITEHRKDRDIIIYAHFNLYITWARVPSEYRDGIEKYLADKLNPLVGERFPKRAPIEVNLPW